MSLNLVRTHLDDLLGGGIGLDLLEGLDDVRAQVSDNLRETVVGVGGGRGLLGGHGGSGLGVLTKLGVSSASRYNDVTT